MPSPVFGANPSVVVRRDEPLRREDEGTAGTLGPPVAAE